MKKVWIVVLIVVILVGVYWGVRSYYNLRIKPGKEAQQQTTMSVFLARCNNCGYQWAVAANPTSYPQKCPYCQSNNLNVQLGTSTTAQAVQK